VVKGVAKMLAVRSLEGREELMCMARKVLIVIAGCELRLPNRNPASLYEGILGACPFVVVSYPNQPFSPR
jgi:hypothetical protein